MYRSLRSFNFLGTCAVPVRDIFNTLRCMDSQTD